ncbi:MAG: aminotransferase class III-fold pyridoxal phosphate-dependent enzyme [Alcanivoracaceae bacterium]|nr:aminotransferase class III-fold pyridoxal phosphate-dependent enzyme [Alcanivoracaceae bacterium]
MRSTSINPEIRKHMDLVGFDRDFVRAEGACLYTDDDASPYLDFSSQYGCLPFGYNDADIIGFIESFFRNQQLSFAQPFQLPYPEKLAERLLALSEATHNGYCVFANSGAETVEVAIKLARQKTGRARIASADNSFHGKTNAALACTGNPAYHEGFFVDEERFVKFPYNDIAALEETLAGEDVAAVIIEPIQGEGGVIMPAADYLVQVKALCLRYGSLLIVDEIQTGLMRTGRMLAHQDIEPDIILLAKALGAGVVPIGACLMARHVWTQEFGRLHSSTFANNNFTCAVALQAIEKLDAPAFGETVLDRAVYLRERLTPLRARYPRAIKSLHGDGLMYALHLHDWCDGYYFTNVLSESGMAASFACAYLLNRHRVLVLPTLNNRNVIRIQPPLIVSRAQIDQFAAGLDDLCQLLEQKRFGELAGAVIPAEPVCMRLPRAARTQVAAATPGGKFLGRFAFFVHPLEIGGYGDIFPYFSAQDPDFLRWVKRYKKGTLDVSVCHRSAPIVNSNGDYVEGVLITAALLPQDLLSLNADNKARLMRNYVRTAEQVGASYCGLGAFTSIITDSGLRHIDSPIPYTTGNGLTARMTIESVLEYFRHDYLTMRGLELSILGPCGSIGRLCLLGLAPFFRKVHLLGNLRNPTNQGACEQVADEALHHALYARDGLATRVRAPAAVNMVQQPSWQDWLCVARSQADFDRALKQSDVVVSATSGTHPGISVDSFKRSAAVFDISRPADVRWRQHQGDSPINYVEAGLCRLNDSLWFGENNVMGMPRGISLACLGETIVHTMAGARDNHSLSRNLDMAEAERIFECAVGYGFRPLMEQHYDH